MRKSRSQSFTFAALFAVSLLLTSCFAYSDGVQDTMGETFTVSPGGTLNVESDIGSIEVRGTSGNQVDIEVIREIRSGRESRAEEIWKDFDIKFSQSGNDVDITAKYERGGLSRIFNNLGRYLKVKFIVTVPERYNLDLYTKGGGISVENIQGLVKTRTSGGGLDFDRIEGDIIGRTSGGGIDIGDVKGNTEVRTSGGGIRIMSAEGPVDAHTSGGGITVEEVMGDIKAHTSGGSIKATITRQPKSDCRLTTSGGGITVYLGGDIGVYVDAKTSGGSVSTDFPVTIQGEIKKNALRAEINGGGPELYLRTSGGSIRIRK